MIFHKNVWFNGYFYAKNLPKATVAVLKTWQSKTTKISLENNFEQIWAFFDPRPSPSYALKRVHFCQIKTWTYLTSFMIVPKVLYKDIEKCNIITHIPISCKAAPIICIVFYTIHDEFCWARQKSYVSESVVNRLHVWGSQLLLSTKNKREIYISKTIEEVKLIFKNKKKKCWCHRPWIIEFFCQKYYA